MLRTATQSALAERGLEDAPFSQLAHSLFAEAIGQLDEEAAAGAESDRDTAALLEGLDVDADKEGGGALRDHIECSSLLKKRRKKMRRHKHKKRLRRNRYKDHT